MGVHVVGHARTLGLAVLLRDREPASAVAAQHVDDLDPLAGELARQASGALASRLGVVGVEDEEHPPDLVSQARLDQHPGGLAALSGVERQLEAGVERVSRLEGQHRDGVLRDESEHQRHRGQDVLG